VGQSHSGVPLMQTPPYCPRLHSRQRWSSPAHAHVSRVAQGPYAALVTLAYNTNAYDVAWPPNVHIDAG